MLSVLLLGRKTTLRKGLHASGTQAFILFLQMYNAEHFSVTFFLSSYCSSVVHLTTHKVNNDAADFFWQGSVSQPCICLFYVYYCKTESLGCSVSGILLGEFILYTLISKPHLYLSFPCKWLIHILLKLSFAIQLNELCAKLYFKMKNPSLCVFIISFIYSAF